MASMKKGGVSSLFVFRVYKSLTPLPTTRPKVLFPIPSSDDSDSPPATRRSTRTRTAVDVPGGVMISTVQPTEQTSPTPDAILVPYDDSDYSL